MHLKVTLKALRCISAHFLRPLTLAHEWYVNSHVFTELASFTRMKSQQPVPVMSLLGRPHGQWHVLTGQNMQVSAELDATKQELLRSQSSSQRGTRRDSRSSRGPAALEGADETDEDVLQMRGVGLSGEGVRDVAVAKSAVRVEVLKKKEKRVFGISACAMLAVFLMVTSATWFLVTSHQGESTSHVADFAQFAWKTFTTSKVHQMVCETGCMSAFSVIEGGKFENLALETRRRDSAHVSGFLQGARKEDMALERELKARLSASGKAVLDLKAKAQETVSSDAVWCHTQMPPKGGTDKNRRARQRKRSVSADTVWWDIHVIKRYD